MTQLNSRAGPRRRGSWPANGTVQSLKRQIAQAVRCYQLHFHDGIVRGRRRVYLLANLSHTGMLPRRPGRSRTEREQRRHAPGVGNPLERVQLILTL